MELEPELLAQSEHRVVVGEDAAGDALEPFLVGDLQQLAEKLTPQLLFLKGV